MIDHILTNIFISGAVIGACSLVFLMQIASQNEAVKIDPRWLRNVQRMMLAALALILLYAADYVARQIAAPWLPNVLLVWAVTLNAIIRIVTMYLRQPTMHKIVAAGLIGK